VLSSSVPLTTPGPTDGARADAEEEAEDPLAAQPDEQRTGTDTTPTRQPAPRSARRRRRRPHIRPAYAGRPQPSPQQRRRRYRRRGCANRPRPGQDRPVDPVPFPPPTVDRRGSAQVVGHAYPAVKRNPAHQASV
jgi:hypothetical protein